MHEVIFISKFNYSGWKYKRHQGHYLSLFIYNLDYSVSAVKCTITSSIWSRENNSERILLLKTESRNKSRTNICVLIISCCKFSNVCLVHIRVSRKTFRFHFVSGILQHKIQKFSVIYNIVCWNPELDFPHSRFHIFVLFILAAAIHSENLLARGFEL